jgi:transposase
MNKPTSIAVDLAKNVFEIAATDESERVLFRRRFSRSRFREFLAKQPPTTVIMEACGSSHYWARTAAEFGHRPVLLPPAYVKPFVLRNKTDRTDTTGLLQARRHPDIREVPAKTEHQQTLTAIHKLRSAWMAARTRRINTVRGLLREFGVFIPQGAKHVSPRIGDLLQSGSEIPDALLPLLAEARSEIADIERRIKESERQLEAIARKNDTVKRLMTIPGVGLLTATAIVAFVGDLSRFTSGRHFAAYLGITPRERSSGDRRRLGGISKRGNSYLRKLLIHGGRSALRAGKRVERPDRLRAWAIRLDARSCHNVAVVALANKIARICWAVGTRSSVYDRNLLDS